MPDNRNGEMLQRVSGAGIVVPVEVEMSYVWCAGLPRPSVDFGRLFGVESSE